MRWSARNGLTPFPSRQLAVYLGVKVSAPLGLLGFDASITPVVWIPVTDKTLVAGATLAAGKALPGGFSILANAGLLRRAFDQGDTRLEGRYSAQAGYTFGRLYGFVEAQHTASEGGDTTQTGGGVSIAVMPRLVLDASVYAVEGAVVTEAGRAQFTFGASVRW